MKKKIRTIVKKCVCSTCGDIAFVEPGLQHFYCKGLEKSFLAKLPASMRNMTNPGRKGTWVLYEAPVQAPQPDLQFQIEA